MSEENYERVLEQLHPLDVPIFRFIRQTGCRPSEARALQRSDICYRSRVLEIQRTWTDGFGGECLVGCKSGSERPLALTEALEATINSVPTRLDTPFVFWNHKTRTAYTRSVLDKRWRSAVKKAGLPHFQLKNATRASFACSRLRAGFGYEEIGAVLGHKHTATTRKYGEIFVDQTSKVLDGNKISKIDRKQNRNKQ